ncbi:hypothetical protein J3R82DRAFT_10673 [Butyriboletus roseoflavus]|nr:hypothetical protein J3R82DRAFT_10673 [Butyriboletus roseoflavus]
MGNLVWHDLARFISVTASAYAVWAGFWGILYRKFFWEFLGGILRNPGGVQPSPKVYMFITVIVKFPFVQIITMVLGFIMIALDYPLPILKGSSIRRSMPLRVVLLILQSFFAVLFYQGTNVCLYSLIATVCYIRALSLGERIEGSKAHTARGGQA